MNPKVSIITATFNSARYVSDALSSIAEQTYNNIEHLIIDGGSVDNTLEITRQYNHVSRIISEKDEGIYDAMNKGIRASTGEIIGILNSDDQYLDADVIQKVVNLFESEQVDAVYADLLYVDSVNTSKVIRYWKSGKFSSKKFFYGWMPPHPTFFVRRELYNKYGLFNTAFASSADYELMLRFLLKHEVNAVYLPEVVVRMRTGGISNANLRNRWRANREDRRAWELNGLKPYFFTIPLKPIRKILQFVSRYE